MTDIPEKNTEDEVTANAMPDLGLAALLLVAKFHGIAAEAEQVRQHLAADGNALSDLELLAAAKYLGLKARMVYVKLAQLQSTPLPCIALSPEDGKHFVIVAADADRVVVQDFPAQAPHVCAIDEIGQRWSGKVLLLASRNFISGDARRFDFSWFIPSLVKYRRVFGEVLFVSLVVQVFSLITPLFFQVIMDKVLVHRSISTLNVLCVGLLVCSVFEVMLTGLRTYIFSHTTNRIDVELGAILFRHLLNLPLAYFSVRRVGDTIARVRELENIRNFLTGQALTAVLDTLFSVVFVAVMCLYSVKLTLIVVISLPLYAVICGALVPVLRVRLQEKFARSSDNQSFLVESVSGIETVKAMAVEAQFVKRWDMQLASYVSASFRANNTANIGQQLIQLIGKLVTLSIIWVGARLVMQGRLTVGQLVAFNMLANQVAAPVLRLAQLWQDAQHVGISMKRLGDVLNVPTELPRSRQMLPALRGHIDIDRVSFRYAADSPLALRAMSLRIAPGEVVGVVGRSGSGKSTVAKLLQRLYVPEQGRIRIDGIDVAVADPAWLRRQVGVVLQENLLFNRSIRENIALIDPSQSLDAVINAAKLAGAHDFILELPQGYDTVLAEQGGGLSGGQRQRLGLARALLGNPRVLVLDEATSALDYESERIIQDNMDMICRGRTVIIIAHRLSAVRKAGRIVVMDHGDVVEIGTPAELVSRGGYYARMVEAQTA